MEQFTFTDKSKKTFLGLIAIGVLSMVYGIIDSSVSSDRIWASALINGWYFFGMALAATFFLAIGAAAQAGWGVVFKRVFEAVSLFLPIGAILLIIVFIGSSLHLNHIYHWMDPELYDETSPHFDKLIAGKQAFLNQPFWWARTLIFLAGWIIYMNVYRKDSLAEDASGDTVTFFKKGRVKAAIFLVFFGYTSQVASWDWLMSIDTHWFSTLYGWFIFSGFWVSGMTMTLLLALWLKSKGYLEQVNQSHLHDMGKWVFGISFLWTYLWFSQFMLIWYSNIPEEVTYFMVRIEDYRLTYFSMILVNFVLPMLLLMSKDMKRHAGVLTFVGVIILFGHWVDAYFLVTPGVMKANGAIGIVEIGMMLGYLGIFLFVVFSQLAKAPLMVQKNALLEESLHHHIN